MKPYLKIPLAGLLVSHALHADPIGVNFGSGRPNASLLATDSAGVVPQTNWNNADGPVGGPLTLNDASGTATATTVIWNTDEEWSMGGPAADANGILLTGWISANDAVDPPATVTLTGIPFDLYNLFVYLNHDRATEDVLIREANSAFEPFLAHENDTDILAAVTLSAQNLTAEGNAGQSGNYVVFSELAQSDLDLILEPGGGAGSADRGAITGIQIVEVIEGDGDGDGLDDNWEVTFGLDPNDNGLDPNNNGEAGNPDNGAEGDPDGDGSPNLEEQERGTSPIDPDSDGDGLLDGVETNDGTFVDADMTGTDPLDSDTDGDAFGDGWEVSNGRNPVDASDNSADAGAIGLNFGAGRADASLLETDVAGIAAQSNWNNLASPTGDAVSLSDDSGGESGATVSWAMDEEWSIGGPAAGPNGTLLNGWVSANNAGAPNTIDIVDIPYDTYDLVVYLNHDRGTEDVLVAEANDAFSPFLGHENDPNILNPITFSQQTASAEGNAGQTGNFFIILDLENPVLNLVIDPAGEAGSADRGSINGIQLLNRGAAGGGLRITSIEPDLDAGTVGLTWNSVDGRSYAIDAGPSLNLTEANEIADIEANGETTTFTESGIDFSNAPKRFYRVRELSGD